MKREETWGRIQAVEEDNNMTHATQHDIASWRHMHTTCHCTINTRNPMHHTQHNPMHHTQHNPMHHTSTHLACTSTNCSSNFCTTRMSVGCNWAFPPPGRHARAFMFAVALSTCNTTRPAPTAAVFVAAVFVVVFVVAAVVVVVVVVVVGVVRLAAASSAMCLHV